MSFNTGGSSSSGSITQILSQGAMDAALTQNATRTFWKSSYQKHAIFALESINQPFTTQTQFGGESQITLNRAGDLLSQLFVKIVLPGLKVQSQADTLQPTQQMFASLDNDVAAQADVSHVLPYIEGAYTEASINTKEQMIADATNSYEAARYHAAPLPSTMQQQGQDTPAFEYAYWTERVGMALIKKAEFKIGGATIESVWSEMLFAMDELCGKAGKRARCTVGATGRDPLELMKRSREEQILYVNLNLFFSHHHSLALPLVACSYHNIQLNITWAHLNSLIVKSKESLIVLHSERNVPISDEHLKASVETTYVHLSSEERDALTSSPQTILITQNQGHLQQITSNQVTARLPFNFPLREMVFMVRRSANKLASDHFNFSGIGGRDPVVSAELLFNNTARVSSKPAIWYREVQPMLHHSSIPNSHVYNYNFGLNSEDYVTPSGSANASRLDSIELALTLQEDIGSAKDSSAELLVFAKNYNVIKLQNGLCGALFSN